MIKIELPEWFVGMLVVLIMLQAGKICLDMVLSYLNHKLDKLKS